MTRRNLSPDESGLLLTFLETRSFPGADALAAQVGLAQVDGGIPTLLDLIVDPSATPSVCADGPVPGRALVDGPGGEPVGEILVWVKDGYLSGLEYAWYTDEAPAAMPSLDRVQRG